MREQTLPRQAQVVLTATMHDVGIRYVDLGHVALQLVLLCFLLSRYVRAATLLSISQERKWFSSLRSLKSKSPVISTGLSKELYFLGVFFDFSELEESSLRRATVADGCLHRRAQSNFRFVPVGQTQCPSTSRRPSLKKSLSSPIMPC